MAKRSEFAGMDLLSAYDSSSKEEEFLPLSEIAVNPDQPRIFGRTEVQDLMESMKRLGLIEPIVVRKAGKGYVIVAGERRYQAANLLGWKEIRAVRTDASEDQCYEMALAENEKRKSLNPWEVGRAIAHLRRERKKTAQEVARLLGYTERYIKQLSSIARLDQESVRQLLEKGVEPSVKNLENLLRQKEGRSAKGEMISPQTKSAPTNVKLDLSVLTPKQRDSFLKELRALKKKYSLK